jgi:hypothetical protein
LSIPSVSIPYGQRFIEVDFATKDQIIQQHHAWDSSVLPVGISETNAPTISTCELWINNIFVNPEIHDIFIKRIGFSLIRVYRKQIYRVNKNADQILLSQLKWPIETLYIGMRPTENLSAAKLQTAWNMYCQVDREVLDLCALSNGYQWRSALASIAAPEAADLTTNFNSYSDLALDFDDALFPADVPTWNELNGFLTSRGYPAMPLPTGVTGTTAVTGAGLVAQATAVQVMRCEATYEKLVKTMNTIQIEAHGVPLYRTTPVEFFNQYVPYTYGAHHINTPVDVGALMVTFNLYPGSYQPSGHVNVSRAREFYFNYDSAYVSSTQPADLVVVAIAINFLLISDGSAVLRYST